MGSSCLEVTMARICVLLFIALVSAISFSGVVAKDITEVELGDTDNSISQLTISEGIIRERRSADADSKKKRKKAGKEKRSKVSKVQVDKKKRRKNRNRKKLTKAGKERKKAGKKGRKITGRKGDKKKRRKNGNRKKVKAGKKVRDGRSKKKRGKKSRKSGKNEKKKRRNRKKYNKKRRNRKKGKKGKKNFGKKKTRKQKQSCSSNEVTRTCMKNALDCMLFDKNQITNWLKQAKRLENHETISSNKFGKKEIFEEARKHLQWAIGGDKSKPSCGPNTTSTRIAYTGIYGETIDFAKEKGYAIGNLTLMENCSVTIEAACNPIQLNLTEFKNVLTSCRSKMKDFDNKSEECRAMTDSVSKQCKCWSDLTVLMEEIKTLDCKRIKETQKAVTSHKGDCIKVFSKCKRSEDHSVEAVYSCMDDHSMKFINQSLTSLADAATSGAAKAEQRLREFTVLSA